MSNFTPYLQRNERFAASGAQANVPAIPFVPFRQLYLITCVDPRVEPGAVFGAELGEAIVARNIGGRVTPSLIADLAWVMHLHENKTPDADWFEIAVVHHTDCGSALFADDDLRRGFAARGFDDAELAALPVLDPAETVRADVAALLRYPNLSTEPRVSGYSYDLATGLLTTVVEPTHPERG